MSNISKCSVHLTKPHLEEQLCHPVSGNQEQEKLKHKINKITTTQVHGPFNTFDSFYSSPPLSRMIGKNV